MILLRTIYLYQQVNIFASTLEKAEAENRIQEWPALFFIKTVHKMYFLQAHCISCLSWCYFMFSIEMMAPTHDSTNTSALKNFLQILVQKIYASAWENINQNTLNSKMIRYQRAYIKQQ